MSDVQIPLFVVQLVGELTIENRVLRQQAQAPAAAPPEQEVEE